MIATKTPANESPYNTKQSTGKTLKRVAKSLPKSPRKKKFIIAKMAQEIGIKGTIKKGSNKGLSEQQCIVIREFYENDKVLWQAPGHKDRIISHENVNGQTCKNTKQVRYMLMSLKDAYELFKSEYEEISVGLSKFCSM